MISKGLQRAVIFDMDGTLCDVEPIRHYVTGERKNFAAFHNASLFCSPNQWVLEECNKFAADPAWAVVIVTARDAKFSNPTAFWLEKYGVEYDALYMRPWDDTRKDAVVKQEILDQIRADGYSPRIAYDDNPAVIEVWERNGIDIVQVS